MFSPPTDNAGRTRLLPLSVPLRFFAAAAAFELAAWLLLLPERELPGGFAGGLGPTLAALHALTLGTLAMTVIGASLQLLPVATVQSVRSPGLAKTVWWLLATGVAVLVAAMARRAALPALAGAAAVALALIAYAGLLAAHLAGAKRQRAMTWHGWLALACLAGVVVTGPLLVLQYRSGWLEDPRGVALAHLVLAGYGFVGLLATGFSYLLVPMFVVSKAPVERVQRWLLAGLAGAVGLASALLLGGAPRAWVAVASAAGFLAAAAHVGFLLAALSRRRSQEGPWTRLLMRAGWASLLASLALGTALASGLATPGLGAVFVVLVVPGWLLSFVLAMLLRIHPFLCAVHAKLHGGSMPSLRALAPAPLAWLVAIMHLAAVALLMAGIAGSEPSLVRLASLSGAVGAAALLGYQAAVLLRSRRAR